MEFGDLANLYMRERSGSYVCCDFYEPGFGYLFTQCGGFNVMVLKDKITTYIAQ